ncbi:MAG: sugar phosphate nucleotidyltransferase [Candidatus Marsarchaeota archaeon]|nr:sugar phosphate nucleotidyltransferase [Candidatus Marsarchaeota archaeon]
MKAIITAAGYGTRLLPATKEIPKEMLPIPYQGSFKPVIQIVFEQLFHRGVRDFIIIVGRGKRVIEDHFTPDYFFTKYLDSKHKAKESKELKDFYSMLEQSDITWINQLDRRGFGDAVLRAEPFAGDDFLIVAADHIPKELPKMPPQSILITNAEDPKNYGVVVLGRDSTIIDIQEKPEKPKTNLIVMPYYRFDSTIFKFLHEVKPDKNKEIQLTQAIKKMIEHDVKIKGVMVNKAYDLGSIEKYIRAYKELGSSQTKNKRKRKK